ncbi:MAG TPA: corrinoid protein [Anaerolineae bacterium]|nr:corrinoid protein [Anaerolineae bacterium]
MSREDEIKKGLYDNTLIGNRKEVETLTNEGVALGMSPMDMLFGALIPSLQEVGRRFEVGDYFVPEMLVSAKAMQGAMVILRPLLVQSGAKPIATVMMFTVKGDVHDIGKNLCNIMLEGAGFTVVDLGVNTSTDKMMAAIKQHNPPVVGMSAFLTTTMPMFKVNMEAMAKEGIRDKVKVMVGGAPVTQEYANKVGADGYAPDANATVRLAKKLVAEMGYDVMDTEIKEEVVAAVQAVEALMNKAGAHETAQDASTESN